MSFPNDVRFFRFVYNLRERSHENGNQTPTTSDSSAEAAITYDSSGER